MRRSSTILLLVVLVIAHVFLLGRATKEKDAPSSDAVHVYIMPSKALKAAVLDYDGIASVYLFLKTINVMGIAIERAGASRVTEAEWIWMYHILDTATDLDPYFYDPYYMANAYLTWDAGLIREANALLEKGSRYRDWDWRMPFYIGFNHFYFLRDNEKASEYLMQASRRPGASPYLASIASKMAFKANRTESAVLFLEELVKREEDESRRKQFESRIGALRAVLFLERAVAEYKKKFNKYPSKIEELIAKKVINAIPKDPLGGKFYIDPHGVVKTTSENMLVPPQRN